jgi:hypothetical protein
VHRPRLDRCLLLLILIAAAQALTACGDLPKARPHGGAAASGDKPAAGTKPGKDADDEAEDDAEEKEDQREERDDAIADLAKARLDLEIARMEAMHESRRDRVASEEARKDKEEAQLKLDTFLRDEKPERLARLELGLEQGRDRVYQSEQELKELEAMYAAEDFASMTKELVLHRGRKQVEFARRELALDESAAKRTREVELPLEETEKQRALEKAQDAHIVANEDYEKNELGRVMRVSDATRAVDDLRRKIKRLDRKLGTKTDVGPPAGGGPQPAEDIDMPPPEMPPPGEMPPGAGPR